MKQKLKLRIKPLSINSTYYHGGARFGKNAKAQDWTYECFSELMYFENKEKLKLLRESFDETRHAYKLHIKWFFPKSILITKSNTLSSKAHDLSNIEKALIDVLFLPSNYSEDIRQGSLNLNLDDKYLIDLHSTKLISETDEPYVELILEIVDWQTSLIP
jgi:hypothetical protein